MSREGFANEIANLTGHYPKGMSDCYKLGMTYGCREDCPQLQRKECEIYEDVEDYLNQSEQEDKK